jgi:hypothetical protein
MKPNGLNFIKEHILDDGTKEFTAGVRCEGSEYVLCVTNYPYDDRPIYFLYGWDIGSYSYEDAGVKFKTREEAQLALDTVVISF